MRLAQFQHCIPGRVLLYLSLLILCFLIQTTQVNAAEYRKELLFGIEPEHNIFDQVEKYRVLASYLSDQLKVEVRLTITSRYGELVDRFKSLHLDGAFLSSYTTAVAMGELYLVPLASLEGDESGPMSRGYVIVRSDSGISDVTDLRGKKAVFVDPATTEGYVFARAYFRQHGVEDFDSFFSNLDFSGSHASAIYAVLDGRADVGAAKNKIFNQLINRDPSIKSELRVMAESPPVPETTLCVRSDLDPVLLEKLRDSLLKMDKTVEGRRVLRQLKASRFIPSDPASFSQVFKMIEDAGLPRPGSADTIP